MTAPTDRNTAMDAVRGLAVMGILLMNIVSFAMPEAAYVNPTAWGFGTPADRAVWVFNQLFFEGRMRGLFALLFGASALLVMDRAAADGRGPVATHLRRMAVLAVIGAAHLVLLWDGDVLLHYALLGLVVWVAAGWPAERLAAAGIVALLLHTLYWSAIAGGLLWTAHLTAQPGADPALTAQSKALLAQLPSPTNPWTVDEVARLRGGYAGIVADRLAEFATLPLLTLQLLGGETLGYMLLGMALFRSGLFTGGWSDVALRRLIRWGYAVGVPVLAALTWWSFASGFSPAVVFGNFVAWPVPFRVAVALAHLALALQLIRRAQGSAAPARLAAVGRMALSNYLATSLVMTTIFYGYGLGLFGHFGRASVNLFAIAMWAAMLLWSRPWLTRFRYGPAEWFWRSLARGRIERLRGAAT